MRIATWVLSAVLLLSDVAYARAISVSRSLDVVDSNSDVVVTRAVEELGGEVERRDTEMDESMAMTTMEASMNANITSNCMAAVSAMTNVSNMAGFAGCYNILAWDPKNQTVSMDFRLYNKGQAKGDFANIPTNQINVTLDFTDNLEWKPVQEVSGQRIKRRDGSLSQIQQYTLTGGMKPLLDLSKLNETLIASLLVPQISLTAWQSGGKKLLMTNMTAMDTAWFVAGQFSDLAKAGTQVASPASTAAAMAATMPFQIPGRTLGIFPTGLIVTSAWALMFIVVFGAGTIGRMRSRDGYRRRVLRLHAGRRG